MTNTYDAIVIGGGHNGLVAGAYLARAGAKTVVLEARHKTGGAASTDAPWPEAPEFKVTTYSYVMSLMPDRIIIAACTSSSSPNRPSAFIRAKCVKREPCFSRNLGACHGGYRALDVSLHSELPVFPELERWGQREQKCNRS